MFVVSLSCGVCAVCFAPPPCVPSHSTDPPPTPPSEPMPSAAQHLFRGILLPDVQSFVAGALSNWSRSPLHAATLLQGDWGDLPGDPRGDPRGGGARRWEQEWLAASGDWGPVAKGGGPCEGGGLGSLYRADTVLEIRGQVRCGDVALVLWYDDGGEGRLAVECTEVVVGVRVADQLVKGEIEVCLCVSGCGCMWVCLRACMWVQKGVSLVRRHLIKRNKMPLYVCIHPAHSLPHSQGAPNRSCRIPCCQHHPPHHLTRRPPTLCHAALPTAACGDRA